MIDEFHISGPAPVVENAMQDMLDGQALRLLRDAVGAEFHSLRVRRWGDDTTGEFVGMDVRVRPRVYRYGSGATIAEAADACRKALEERR